MPAAIHTMHSLNSIALVSLVLTLTSCLSYSKARFRDLTDTVSFTIGSSVGATVIAGPVILGAEIITNDNQIGLRGGYFGSFDQDRPDLPAATCVNGSYGVMPGLGDQLYATDNETRCLLKLRGKDYRAGEWPPYRFGAMGFSVGIFLIGLRFEVNLIEIFVFAAGIFGLDPLRDDSWAETPRLHHIPSPAQRCANPEAYPRVEPRIRNDVD